MKSLLLIVVFAVLSGCVMPTSSEMEPIGDRADEAQGSGRLPALRPGPAIPNPFDLGLLKLHGAAECVIDTNDAACNDCFEAHCIPECELCSGNAACLAMIDCIDVCGVTSSCVDACGSEYPTGFDDLVGLLGVDGCLEQHCADECNSSLGDFWAL